LDLVGANSTRSAAYSLPAPVRQRGKTSSPPGVDLSAHPRGRRGGHDFELVLSSSPIALLTVAGREHAAKRVVSTIAWARQGTSGDCERADSVRRKTRRRVHRRSPSSIERCIVAHDAVDRRADGSVFPARRAWSREGLRARATEQDARSSTQSARDRATKAACLRGCDCEALATILCCT